MSRGPGSSSDSSRRGVDAPAGLDRPARPLADRHQFTEQMVAEATVCHRVAASRSSGGSGTRAGSHSTTPMARQLPHRVAAPLAANEHRPLDPAAGPRGLLCGRLTVEIKRLEREDGDVGLVQHGARLGLERAEVRDGSVTPGHTRPRRSAVGAGGAGPATSATHQGRNLPTIDSPATAMGHTRPRKSNSSPSHPSMSGLSATARGNLAADRTAGLGKQRSG